MLQNYIRIAWRNILKNRFYSLLNIAGLATGIAFAMLIMAYVWNELQVNTRLKNANKHYILQSKWKDPNMGYELASIGALPKALKEQYPTLVKNYYRWDGITTNVTVGEKSFREGLQIGDSTLLSMYGFKVLYGDATTALRDPYSIVITDEMAKKYFGKTDVVGKAMTIESFSGSKHDFLITAILQINGKNSVVSLNDENKNELFLPLGALSYFGRTLDNWTNTAIVGMIEVQDGVQPENLKKPVAALLKQNTAAQIYENLTPYFVPLKDYYLDKDNSLVKRMLYTLAAIALFILLMAVVNFINMSVSRSSSRMKEIGVRKVLGGLRRQLIWQFLIESTILVCFSSLLAFVIYLLASPAFGQLLDTKILAPSAFPLYFIVFPLLLIFITGLAAGLYPAFVLSALKSVDSLKGKLKTVKDNVLLRKSLVAFQFFTAAIVLIAAFIISKQVQLFFSRDLGYSKDFIVSAQVPRDWTPAGINRMQGIRNQFAAMPEVKDVTLSFEVPDGNNSGSLNIHRAESDSNTAVASFMLTTDQYYAATYGIPMAGGQFFNEPVDTNKVVINETLARSLGWKNPEDAIGRQVKMKLTSNIFTVAGVTKDFHFTSMQKAMQPIIFLHVKLSNIFRFYSFKVKGTSSIAALQRKWSELMPGAPFEYKFMDDRLAKMYKTEIQLKQAAYTATLLSIIIVLLGVTGMISLSVQKRTKEIGIRKVLGSSVSGIVGLFVKEFMVVIAVAGLVACPVAYIIMQRWLNNYVYRIDITVTPFIITIAILAIVTGILIVLQTINAALRNPARSLKTE
ncbi:ABC-type antimicrobial peptide transport system, permease component [Chitinophaga sp. CF118]|uniref:ABC transporter permease n=1 Tax=Chitinophaga sp. CF118 TaxID=1884367 RepID=UPI0008E5F4D5|nr:ABC transporter permease [Chitinophaga sp. CF118]SFD74683.1 ABC-type antimicrobial peptide transport system, permease component [Chitinophaga sp. CF118]